MEELIREFGPLVSDQDGTLYVARIYAAPADDKMWEAWLTFSATDGRMLKTARETTQPNRDAIAYWASGIEPIYLEGALKRALRHWRHAGESAA